MERLSTTPVVADFRQQEPVRLSEKKSERLYAISWTGVIHSVNLFECVTLHFEEHGAWHVTEATHLMDAPISPVCAPSIAKRLRKPADLANEDRKGRRRAGLFLCAR